jgi:hypothetical protein
VVLSAAVAASLLRTTFAVGLILALLLDLIPLLGSRILDICRLKLGMRRVEKTL